MGKNQKRTLIVNDVQIMSGRIKSSNNSIRIYKRKKEHWPLVKRIFQQGKI